MDYFSPGAREAGRRVRRAYGRARLWRDRRRLAKAEAELGLLGWQQADFDDETQQQVEAIQNVEREQSRLMNAAAEHATTVRTRRGELESAQRAWQEKRRELAAEEKRCREPRAELERQLAERRRVEPNFERRMPELDRELREVMRLVTELLRTEPQTAKIRQELLRVRERSIAIPNEKSDLRTQHLRTVSEIRRLEQAAGGEPAGRGRGGRADAQARGGVGGGRARHGGTAESRGARKGEGRETNRRTGGREG